MRRIWQFLKEPSHLAILAAIGGVISFLWTQFAAPRLNPPVATPHPVSAAPAPQYATANGGTAVNGSGQAVVDVDDAPASGASVAPAASAASTPPLPPGQYANAGAGGTAVNAADTSRVHVHHHVADGKK